jgi:phage host-nuclease inhibitor protein Gam
MARPKKAAAELATLADCNDAMGQLREAETDLASLTADRDRAVAAAQTKYEVKIDAAKASAKGLRAALEAYYYAHLREIEQGDVKHVQLPNGRMGRRDNPPALVPLNRSWTKKAILNAVKVLFGLRFLRVKEEVDLVALKDAKLAVEQLKQLGLKVEAGETFYAEPARLPAGE